MRARKVRFVRPEEDPEALADSAEPDFAGAWPNFGKATRFVPGRTFEVEGNAVMSAELLLGVYTAMMRVIVLRLFVPYGAGQGKEMLIPKLIERVRQDAPILLDGEDGLRVNPVAVTDVVETIDRCLTADCTATLNVVRRYGFFISAAVNFLRAFSSVCSTWLQVPSVLVRKSGHEQYDAPRSVPRRATRYVLPDSAEVTV